MEPVRPVSRSFWSARGTGAQAEAAVCAYFQRPCRPADDRRLLRMYARVTVNFFPYDASGNRGVGFGLGNVCKTRDGEPLGSRANAVRQRTPVRFRSWCGRH